MNRASSDLLMFQVVRRFVGVSLGAAVLLACEPREPVDDPNADLMKAANPGAFEIPAPVSSTGTGPEGPAWVVRVRGDARFAEPPPVTITSLAVAGDYLYFAPQWEALYRAPKQGGPIEVVDAQARAQFEPVSGDGARAVWAHTTFDDRDYPTLRVKEQQAATGQYRVLFEGAMALVRGPSLFQARPDGVFMSAEESGARNGAIWRLGEGQRSLTALLPRQSLALFGGWAVEGGWLYYTACEGAACQAYRLSTAGGSPEALVPLPQGEAHVRAVDGTHVYLTWAHGIWRLPKGGGAVTEILAITERGRSFDPSVLQVDAQNVYYLRGSPPGVSAVPKEGGAPQMLWGSTESRYTGVGQLAQDDTHLYVLDKGLAIVRVPKPARR